MNDYFCLCHFVFQATVPAHRHDRSNKDDDESESMKKDKDTEAHLDNACLCTMILKF